VRVQIAALVRGCHVQVFRELDYCGRFQRHRIVWLELRQTVVQKGIRIGLGRILPLKRPRFLPLCRADMLLFFRFC
jgi:hypothetical protein